MADLGGAESLHEMSARKNRRAKRKKKTQEDKIKKVKALLKPHPGKLSEPWFPGLDQTFWSSPWSRFFDQVRTVFFKNICDF